MSHLGLNRFTISVPNRLGRVNDMSHLRQLFLCQINIPRRPILLQSTRLGRTRNSNHALGRNPSECNLGDLAASSRSKFLDLVHNSFVFIEVLALEFWCCRSENLASLQCYRYLRTTIGRILTSSTEVIRCHVVQGFIREIINKPPATERTISYIGYAQILGCLDQAVCLVQCLESRVFRLDSINLGDCESCQ